jgi:hypothetical protein
MDYLSILLNLLLGVAGIVAFLVFLELFISFQQTRRRKKEHHTIMSIRVSKENETGPIVAEQIFSTIHSISREISFWERLRGISQDQVSFEIANVDRNIRFYVQFPTRLKNLVEGQIYAQYPNVEIVEAEDYAKHSGAEVSASRKDETNEGRDVKALVKIGEAGGVKSVGGKEFMRSDEFKNAICAELSLTDPDFLPIKRYPQFEDKKAKVAMDPLAAITSTLAKFNDPDEQAWIQIVVRPLDDKWRHVYTKCIKLLAKGLYMDIEKLKKAYAKAFITRSRIKRIVFFPVYWFFALQGLKAGKVSVATESSGGGDVQEQISKTHEKETSVVAAIDKVGKLMYETTVRIVYVPKAVGRETAMIKLREIAGSFKQFNIPQLNGFRIEEIVQGDEAVRRYREREMEHPFVLNVEELATVYHMPNTTVTTPNIYWVRSKRLEPPVDLPTPKSIKGEDLTILGKSNFRGSDQVFGIKGLDRRRHIYIIGKTGMGKSTLLENMIFSDIQAGRGLAVVDPHGDLADAVMNFIPARRTNDVVLFDPSDRDFPVAFNMLENIDPNLNSIVSSGLVGIFKKIYGESWGPRLEHILRNTILALLEYPNTTMLGIPRMLQDREFRGRVVRKITDPIVHGFWVNEFEKLDPKQRMEAISPILNKVGQFLSSPIIRNILGQPKSAIDLRFAMDHGKIVIVNLSKGKIGEDTSSLLGAMIITKFQLDAMSRANVPEKDRKDFYLYVDEFQNFATDSFATILSEARKYKLNLTMANQYIAQMPEEVRDAVFGNVGSIISFQVGFDDAEYMSGQYGEEVLPNDLVSLSKYTAYTRLLVDGMPSKTFSLDTLPPPDFVTEEGRREKVVKMSRERYATPRDVVEDKIRRWSASAHVDEAILKTPLKIGIEPAKVAAAEPPKVLPAAVKAVSKPNPKPKQKREHK